MKAAKKLDQALEDYRNEHGPVEQEQEFMASPQCTKKQQVLFKNWLHHMRAKVYGGCSASILFPAAKKTCYAIAQGVVKAKIAQWTEKRCSVEKPEEELSAMTPEERAYLMGPEGEEELAAMTPEEWAAKRMGPEDEQDFAAAFDPKTCVNYERDFKKFYEQ